MAKTTNTLRQLYKIRGGQIEVKIATDSPLTAAEIKDFGRVITACEGYVERWQPARTERLEAEARAAEFTTS